MVLLRHSLVALAVVAVSSTAMANITSVAATSSAYVAHNNVASNPVTVFSSSVSGVPHSFYSPYTLSSPGTMNYSSEVSTSAAITQNTATSFEFRSTFAADVACFGSPNGVTTGNVGAGLGSTVSFTLDAPGTLTIFSTNTVTNTAVGSQQAAATTSKIIWLNNSVVYSTFSDGTLVIPLLAGSHQVDVSEGASASFVSSPIIPADSASAFGTTRTRILIQSVPEPTSVAAIGLGLAALIRRRKR
jgi:hypothetical protein